MRWTPEDEAKLRELYSPTRTFKEIGDQLGRSKDAVQMKAAEMGLGPKPYKGYRSTIWPLIEEICKDGRARTVHELVELTGASRVSIDKLLKDRHGDGLAHVVRWRPNPHGQATPLWLPVPGKDAKRPKVVTPSERQAERMRRMREEDPLRYKAIIDRCAIRRKLKKHGVLAQQHPLVQALFGMGAQA
jgi:hypothetical protein